MLQLGNDPRGEGSWGISHGTQHAPRDGAKGTPWDLPWPPVSSLLPGTAGITLTGAEAEQGPELCSSPSAELPGLPWGTGGGFPHLTQGLQAAVTELLLPMSNLK